MAAFIVSLASILIALSLYSMSRQKSYMDNIYRDLNSALSEAAVVKEDMEEMMERALQTSRNLVNELDQECNAPEEVSVRSGGSVSEGSSNKLQDQNKPGLQRHASPQKRRIYELAHEMGMPTCDMLELVRKLGMVAPNHMKSLDAHQIDLLREQLRVDSELNKAPEEIKTPVRISGEETAVILSSEPVGNNVLPFNLDDIKASHPTIAVRRLQEQGYATAEIAQTLGRGQGEIQLIMNLSNRKCANK